MQKRPCSSLRLYIVIFLYDIRSDRSPQSKLQSISNTENVISTDENQHSQYLSHIIKNSS